MLDFPQLSRKPALKRRRQVIDPTIRSDYENGMESARKRFTRMRRQYDVSYTMLTQDDLDQLDDFVDTVAGAVPFNFPDDRNPRNPRTLQVRFATLPSDTDEDNTDDGIRSNVTFTLREL